MVRDDGSTENVFDLAARPVAAAFALAGLVAWVLKSTLIP